MRSCPECGLRYPSSESLCSADGSSLVEATDPLLGESVGNYRIVRLIGQGGMGEVYLGLQPSIGSRVAIKVLSHAASNDSNLVERFFTEARLVNKIRHEGIVNVLDMGQLPDGRPMIIMEHLDGETLSRTIQRGSLPLAAVANIAAETLDALQAAHETGVVHRDLKPDNIFLSPQGRTKVLDFGVAKLMPSFEATVGASTRAGDLLGTPAYMAPEQISEATITPAVDIFAMGAILYEMVTGGRPFEAGSMFELLRKILEAQPAPPIERRSDLGPDFQELILQCLAKSPVDRGSAKEVAARLRQISSTLGPAEALPIGEDPAPDTDPMAPTFGSDGFEATMDSGVGATLDSNARGATIDSGAMAPTMGSGGGATLDSNARGATIDSGAMAPTMGSGVGATLDSNARGATMDSGAMAPSARGSTLDSTAKGSTVDSSAIGTMGSPAIRPTLDSGRQYPTVGPVPNHSTHVDRPGSKRLLFASILLLAIAAGGTGAILLLGSKADPEAPLALLVTSSDAGPVFIPSSIDASVRIVATDASISTPTQPRPLRQPPKPKETPKETAPKPTQEMDASVPTVTSGVKFIETGYDKRAIELKTTFNTKTFDGTWFLPQARKLAKRIYSDAVLTEFEVPAVFPTGKSNLHLGDIEATYIFRSPSRSTKRTLPVGLPEDIACMVYIDVSKKNITAYPVTANVCKDKLRPTPRCSVKQIWAKAIAMGAPTSGHVAKISYLWDDWFFDIDTVFTESIPDDC